MKKTFILALAVVLCLTTALLAGCGDKSTTGDSATASPGTKESGAPEETGVTEETGTPEETGAPEETETSEGTEGDSFDFSEFASEISDETMIEKVILDDEYLTVGVYAVGKTKAFGSPAYFLRIVNKTDHSIALMPKDGTLNVEGTSTEWAFSKAQSTGYLLIGAGTTEDTALTWEIADSDERREAFDRMKNIEGTIILGNSKSLPDIPVIKEYSFSDSTGTEPTMK